MKFVQIREIRVKKNHEKNIQVYFKYHSEADINSVEYCGATNISISIKRKSFYRSN